MTAEQITTVVSVVVAVLVGTLATLQRLGMLGGVDPRRKRSDPPPPTPKPSLPPRRSEQIPEWARDTWTRERAEREAAEAEARASEIENRRDARERITALERANSNHVQQLGRIDYRLSAIEAGQKESRDVLGTVRDAVLVMRAQCPRCDDSDPAPVVVRGGAAARSV